MAELFTPPTLQVIDANGVPMSGAKLFFYQTGTTTPVTIYQDIGLATPHANPVIADAAGRFAPIYVSDPTVLKTVLKDASDVTIQTVDPLAASLFITDAISGMILVPTNKSYNIVQKVPFAGTITETVSKSASGTCTATFKINTTALGGAANAVSSAEQAQAQASANTFVAGDDIVITISANSACLDMSYTIKISRVAA